MVSRKSPTPDEIDRINEVLERRAKFQIQDRDSYDLAFNDYLNIVPKAIKGFQKTLQDRAFEDYLENHPDVSKERLHTKARGKDLKRDRLKTAKTVVETRREFIKKGASKVDLRAFDTETQRVTKEILRRRRFTVKGLIRGRVIFVEKTSVVVSGKKQLRFRDVKGRFASSRIKS